MPDNILFSSDPSADLKSFLQKQKYSKIAVLVDDNTALFCYPEIQNAISEHAVITVKSGEEQKNLQTCEQIWSAMTDHQLDRHAVLVILGGGVLGDMGGFCAATYKRGIDFILIPTTLLSQVDASIGGKLGIDFHHFKNHIGVFQTPALTLLFSGFLQTLPFLEIRSGFAEVIKHILISDKSMWEQIQKKSLEEQAWDQLIRHSVEFKAGVVREDPTEKGLRKILNTGHTIGHAIETYLLSVDRKVMHGEAIAAGLIAEAWLASRKNLLTEKSLDEIVRYITRIFGKVQLSADELDPIAKLTLQDKKNKGNKILSVLLEDIGTARFDCEINEEEVKQALQFYRDVQI
jgi:3-dehydroquinate synthase